MRHFKLIIAVLTIIVMIAVMGVFVGCTDDDAKSTARPTEQSDATAEVVTTDEASEEPIATDDVATTEDVIEGVETPSTDTEEEGADA